MANDPTDPYIERGAAALDMELAAQPHLQEVLVGLGFEQRIEFMRPIVESVLDASGALEAVYRLDGLDR